MEESKREFFKKDKETVILRLTQLVKYIMWGPWMIKRYLKKKWQMVIQINIL